MGIALVGYIHVLEQMGIRFIRLAGTSAGAINTALRTVIGNKNEAKSINVLDAICKLDFFSLVDGHPAARWIIKRFISRKNFLSNFKKLLLIVLGTFLLLIIGNFFLLVYLD